MATTRCDSFDYADYRKPRLIVVIPATCPSCAAPPGERKDGCAYCGRLWPTSVERIEPTVVIAHGVGMSYST